jgi:hypothetical protein
MSDRGRKWDGKSRVSNDLYRKRFDEIFKKKKDPFDIKIDEANGELTEEEFKKIEDRNGF